VITDLSRKDLVCLVADKNMEASLRGILSRSQSLQIRQVNFDLFVHPDRDPGCLLRSHDFLRPFANHYEHALVVLDQEGCGQRGVGRSELETGIEGRLGGAGWADRAAAVVIAPELENWVWSDSPHVDRALGWEGKAVPLRSWLQEEGLLQAGSTKPSEPKRAVELVLRTVRTPRSSAIYLALAQSVSTERCTDPAFAKLRRCLRGWFPQPSTVS
jgi:hypothetical protein